MTDDLVTALLPLLSRSLQAGFNVFDVMHHGTHEKQISNDFRWLLEAEGTHNLGDAFQRIFIDEVNRGLVGDEPFMPGPYVVRQEVNTSDAGDGEDIADLVLESDVAVLVVENYITSDGHGHNYAWDAGPPAPGRSCSVTSSSRHYARDLGGSVRGVRPSRHCQGAPGLAGVKAKPGAARCVRRSQPATYLRSSACRATYGTS